MIQIGFEIMIKRGGFVSVIIYKCHTYVQLKIHQFFYKYLDKHRSNDLALKCEMRITD